MRLSQDETEFSTAQPCPSLQAGLVERVRPMLLEVIELLLPTDRGSGSPSLHLANPFFCDQREQRNSESKIQQTCHANLSRRKFAGIPEEEDK
jgi:hypothetical protein